MNIVANLAQALSRRNSNPAWIQQFIDAIPNHLGDLVLTAAILLITTVVGYLMGRVVSRTPVQSDTNGGNGRFAGRVREELTGSGRLLARVTRVSIWIAALIAIAFIWFRTSLTIKSDKVKEVLVYLGVRIGATLIVVAATLVVARILQRTVYTTLHKGRVNTNLALLGGRIVYVSTLAVGVVVVLAVWDTGIVFPVALLGALTVALSLALQDVLKNLVAGIYMLLEHPFVIGDQITLEPYTGEVEDIQIRFTSLRTANGQRVVIPNSMLFSSPVVNHSAFRQRRAGLTVTIPDPGPEGIDRAEEQIRAAIATVPGVLQTPAPQVIFSRAAGGKVDLRVVFWLPTGDIAKSAALYSEVLEQIRAKVPDAEVSTVDAATSVVV
ncbi:MAG: mechanosensitive ion channel family protein [Ktedonobacterales bacterium]